MPYPVLFTLAMKREEAMSTPTTDDLLINEKVMGRCNHRRFRHEVVQRKRASYLKLVCEGCGDSADVDPDLFNESPEIQSDYMTASMTPVYSQHLPVARTVIRRLESRGWTSSMRVTNGAIVLSLVKTTCRSAVVLTRRSRKRSSMLWRSWHGRRWRRSRGEAG